MKYLIFNKNNLILSFLIDDEERLQFLYMGKKEKEYKESTLFLPAEVFLSGKNPDDHHGAKHTGSEVSGRLKYISHRENQNEIVFELENEDVKVYQHYEFYSETDVVRSYSEVINISENDIGLEYISSFCMYNINVENITLCHNSWKREFDWRKYKPEELGYSRNTPFSMKRILISNTGTWSTKEYMPMGMIKDGNEVIFWQIENNGSWNFEISDLKDTSYLKLSGPSEQENSWWKNLKPGEAFKSVSVAIAISCDFDGAIAEMTKYRRKIVNKIKADKYLPVIFNDYNCCLRAEPTTEKEIPVIDVAAKLGADIYCMDAGWYADGTWWETVGEWKVCEKRFPNGMNEVFDYIHKKGMKAGIWLEPEVMGINCPILDQFSDDCFFVRHGKRVIDHGRYLLDFRNKKVTDFLDGVIDGLVQDYGIEFFKFDYNIDGGLGTEIQADSFGDGLMGHQKAYLDWIDGIFKRHPDIIIENCASGGMRMDYKSLTHFSLQSISDAEDYVQTAFIAAMSGTALLPEQAETWVLPMVKHTKEEIEFNVVNSMFKRMEISGEAHLLSTEQFECLKEGVDFYKSIRNEIPTLIPYYPIGVINFENDWVVSGYKNKKKNYLCIGNMSADSFIEFPIDLSITKACCVYPHNTDFKIELNEGKLKVYIPSKNAVVVELA